MKPEPLVMAQQRSIPDSHSLDATDVLARLGSRETGLNETEARQRREQYGPNQLPAPPRHSAWLRFLRQFHNVLIYVLLGAAAVTALLGHWVDMAVILAVVLVNAIIGFLQEGKAEKALEAIRDMLAPMASVIREGKRRACPGEDLVPGDVVLLEAGDKVPADLRLLSSHGLMIQEAILTGESVPEEKQSAAVAAETVLGDRSCMAYSGTLVTNGQARGVVVTTGAATEIGRISGLLTAVEPLTTPLIQHMTVFGKWLTFIILMVAMLLLGYGTWVQQQPFSELLMAIVGLSVAAIPEGLPAVLTITLAIGVQVMARRNAIVRRLPAIETLGTVSVICTDKTGTLTRNEMMVASVVTPDQVLRVTGSGYSPGGEILGEQKPAQLNELARAAVLCNDAALHEADTVWSIEGDPMEGALLTLARKVGLNEHDEQRHWHRTDAIPFDAQHRFMATLHHNHQGHARVYVKGAPERILAMCHQQYSDCGEHPALDSAYWLQQAEQIAQQGQRVLALALLPVQTEHTVLEFADVEGGLTLLGLVGLLDPPRPEAIEAVAECRRAGIRVKMITGDHAGTAAAIASQIGLQNPSQVLTGHDLDTMNDSALAEAVLTTDVFARTSPEHKLRLVMALQAHDLTVAMTGDGVNDAPALKRADAGIAMGRKGSEAAKEAAELVLVDDNFASIVAAVREGRTVYDNLKKVIGWTLPTSAGEALTIIVGLLLGTTLPITPVQILWINLITAVTLGLALAFEPTEDNTMRVPPRPRSEPLMTRTLIWQITWVSLLFLCGMYGLFSYALQRHGDIELARTVAVNTMVVLEIFYLFFMRNSHGTSLTRRAVMGTPAVWATVGVVTLAQFAITYLPFMQSLFATQAVPLLDGLLIIGVGVGFFVIVEVEKQIRLRWGTRSGPVERAPLEA